MLDLRNCAAGAPEDGIALANLFLNKGRITYLVGQKVPRENFEADPAKAVSTLPMAVLVNRGTAGGAEIAAAALQDNKRGPAGGRAHLWRRRDAQGHQHGRRRRHHPLRGEVLFARWPPDPGQAGDAGQPGQRCRCPGGCGRQRRAAHGCYRTSRSRRKSRTTRSPRRHWNSSPSRAASPKCRRQDRRQYLGVWIRGSSGRPGGRPSPDRSAYPYRPACHCRLR